VKAEPQAMTLPEDPLELLALLCKNMEGLEVGAGVFEGRVTDSLDFADVVSRLETADLLETSYPTSRTVEGRLPPSFFCSMDEFLEAPSRRRERPARFYVRDLDLLVDSEAPVESLPTVVRHYTQATRLFNLLIKVADHVGGVAGDKTCILLRPSGKLEIRCNYGYHDLVELVGLDAFESDFVRTETHAAQKVAIIKTALGEIFAGTNRIDFSALLRRFEAFADKVRGGYDLYMAEFSFQKVKEAIEREKLDAMVKLNKVFSDIQNQLLAVPAALVLIGGQMQEGPTWQLKNVLIWLGALVFVILMSLLIRNQRHTLKAVKDEIDQQRAQFEIKYKNLVSRFEAAYGEIDKRYRHQACLITTVDALVGLSFICASAMLLWYSNALWPFWRVIRFF
jgi:hypothetical protein